MSDKVLPRSKVLENRWINRPSSQRSRHPIDESLVQKTVGAAGARAGVRGDKRWVLGVFVGSRHLQTSLKVPRGMGRARKGSILASKAVGMMFEFSVKRSLPAVRDDRWGEPMGIGWNAAGRLFEMTG